MTCVLFFLGLVLLVDGFPYLPFYIEGFSISNGRCTGVYQCWKLSTLDPVPEIFKDQFNFGSSFFPKIEI
jgi:hypothetical protein